jgi:hypothetical protein
MENQSQFTSPGKDHNFIPSIGNPKSCARCKMPFQAHTDTATCEACSNIGPVEIMYGSVLLCPVCASKERALQVNNNTEVKQVERIEAMYDQMEKEKQDIKVVTDIFNAKVLAIVDMKSTIDTDDTVTNKPYAFAKALSERFEHLKNVIFEKNKEIAELGAEQRAIMQELNQLSNKLRETERNELKIADISYTPSAPKVIKLRTTSPTPSKPKIDKAEVRQLCKENGVPEFMVYQIIVARNVSAVLAVEIVKKANADMLALANKAKVVTDTVKE